MNAEEALKEMMFAQVADVQASPGTRRRRPQEAPQAPGQVSHRRRGARHGGSGRDVPHLRGDFGGRAHVVPDGKGKRWRPSGPESWSLTSSARTPRSAGQALKAAGLNVQSRVGPLSSDMTAESWSARTRRQAKMPNPAPRSPSLSPRPPRRG